MSVSMRVDDSALQRTVARASQAAARPPMRDVATVLAQLVRNTFRTERDPWGAAWPAHSLPTLAARRRKKNASVQKLIDSGKMYASIRDSHTDTDATVWIGEGLDNPRAFVHQFGAENAGRSRRVRIPARPFSPLRDANTLAMPDPWWSPICAPIERDMAKAVA